MFQIVGKNTAWAANQQGRYYTSGIVYFKDMGGLNYLGNTYHVFFGGGAGSTTYGKQLSRFCFSLANTTEATKDLTLSSYTFSVDDTTDFAYRKMTIYEWY